MVLFLTANRKFLYKPLQRLEDLQELEMVWHGYDQQIYEAKTHAKVFQRKGLAQSCLTN